MEDRVDLAAGDAKKAALKIKRRLIRLRADVLAARARWENFFKTHAGREEVLWGDWRPEGARTLYLLRASTSEVTEAICRFQADLVELARRVGRMPDLSRGDREKLWLPGLFQNTDKFIVKTYHSSSVTEASRSIAGSMLERLEKPRPTPSADGRFVIARPPVIDRYLQGDSGGEVRTVRMNLPLWAVCILGNKPFPKILLGKDLRGNRSLPGKQTARATERKLRQRTYLEGKNVEVLAEDDRTMVFFLSAPRVGQSGDYILDLRRFRALKLPRRRK